MRKRGCVVAVVLCGLATGGHGAGADLTAVEQHWLLAARPVLVYAREQGLPLDIIVQPQATPGETPVGMAFVNGRCKLVLSLRGNPGALAALDRVEASLVGPVVEAMAAHELAHCWRHVTQGWGQLPAGVQDVSQLERLSAEHAELLREMWRTRREEGFADLVGLAWTREHHPEAYAAVDSWNAALRAQQPVDTGPHDTRAWVRLAADPARFGAAGSIFDAAQGLWKAGMLPAGEELATLP